jgi:hypothetical protein
MEPGQCLVDGLFGTFCVCLHELVAGLDLVWNMSSLRQMGLGKEDDGCGDMNGRVEVCFLRVVICIGYDLRALFHLVGTCELVLDWIADHGMEPEKLHIVFG